MEHKTLEAKAVATDLGEFTAIAAAYSVDRGRERIVPGAFKATIERWQESGKRIPLHWDHSGDAKDIIGTVDPSSMTETEHGLQVAGKLDLDESEVAKDAWRAMKANAVALSFGYMVTESGTGEDGVTELKTIDLFEISITPAPMNPDTRFIDLKSMAKGGVVPDAVTVHVHPYETVIPGRSGLLPDQPDTKDVEPPPTQPVEDVSDEGTQPSRKASDPEADEFQLERIRALASQ